ncbi:MAG: hypothetical protein DI549_20490 [Ancylobacter novellus]|uniref:Uncharacterized protein n=1 Tax=Ancylobacter novellus TaxID=921 RepID=A0A2W5QQI1_ANCNO|nr:MAG: hypothetical protein DI549_20490 [Ancylobacter novellus]
MNVLELKAARAKARGGAWVKDIALGELETSIDVKARSLRNADFEKLRGELVRALPPEHQEKLPDDVGERILAEALVGAVVVDWSLDEPCTVELLTDPEIGVYLRGAMRSRPTKKTDRYPALVAGVGRQP